MAHWPLKFVEFTIKIMLFRNKKKLILDILKKILIKLVLQCCISVLTLLLLFPFFILKLLLVTLISFKVKTYSFNIKKIIFLCPNYNW